MENKLLATLKHLCEYWTYAHIAASYRVHESQIVRCDHGVEISHIKDGTFRLPGKKKRHTIKSQVIINKADREVVCTTFSNGKRHDFRLFKESKVLINKNIKVLVDTGFQGISKFHQNLEISKKKQKTSSYKIRESE